MKIKLSTAVALFSVAAGLLAGALPASAAPPSTGNDNLPDVIIGGGSDTTYLIMQRLDDLYNSAPGCTIITSGSSADKGKCNGTGQTTPTTGNFDHDVVVEATPTGSGGGINALLGTSPYNPGTDYARSSRGPSGTEGSSLSFYGYAKDSVAVITFGTRTGISVTKSQLQAVYRCDANARSWDFLTGNPADASSPIRPIGMNTTSGTYSVFQSTYLGGVTFGACVEGTPFENDVKPVLATAATAADAANMLWWISFGDWQTYPYTRDAGFGASNAGATVKSNLATVDGVLPSNGNTTNGSYPITRFLYHVTRTADAAPDPADLATPNVIGATTGKAGAVREYTEFLCRASNTLRSSVAGPASGNGATGGTGLRTLLTQALNAEGFVQVPSTGTDRNFGACHTA